MTVHDGPTGPAALDVHAPAEAVRDLVADVERMGRWSPETVEAHLIGGATCARPGARFTGTNTRLRSWTTTCTVTEADRPRRLSFSVGAAPPGATTSPDHGRLPRHGVLPHRPRAGPVGRWLTRVATGVPWPRRVDDLVAGMVTMLERLRTDCEHGCASQV